TDKRQPIDFVSKRTIATIISLVLLIGSVVSLATQGLNFGIDFTGGTMIELSYQTPAELDKIREKLNQAGYQEAVVQNFGSIYDVLIRLPAQASPNMAELSNQIVSLLQQSEVELDIRRIEFVGPQVGKELTEQGGLAMVYALIGILIYVAFRFEYRFA
ncbi:MAG TPA: protein translocase subunit SecF, partial [Gammaproteobacteria bacterium]|nr:protein translocase subunit SecF [Gammaproteobacteria bacterium]